MVVLCSKKKIWWYWLDSW